MVKTVLFSLANNMILAVKCNHIDLVYMDNFFKCLELLTSENPLLSKLFFDDFYINKMFVCDENKQNLSKYFIRYIEFYFNLSKIIVKYNYDIFFFHLEFKIQEFLKTNFKDSTLQEKYEIFTYLILLIKEIIKHKRQNKRTIPYNIIKIVINKLKEEVNIENLMRKILLEDSIPENFTTVNDEDEIDENLKYLMLVDFQYPSKNIDKISVNFKESILYNKYSKKKFVYMFFKLIITYYRLLQHLDYDIIAEFVNDSEVIVLISIFNSKVPIYPFVLKALSSFLSKYVILRNYDLKLVTGNTSKENILIEEEIHLRKIESMTIMFMNRSLQDYEDFPIIFNQSKKFCIDYYYEMCFKPFSLCLYKSILLRKEPNYQNNFATYSLISMYLKSLKKFTAILKQLMKNIYNENPNNVSSEINSYKSEDRLIDNDLNEQLNDHNNIDTNSKKTLIHHTKNSSSIKSINQINFVLDEKEKSKNIIKNIFDNLITKAKNIIKKNIIVSKDKTIFTLLQNQGYFNLNCEKDLDALIIQIDSLLDLYSSEIDSLNLADNIENIKKLNVFLNNGTNIVIPFHSEKKKSKKEVEDSNDPLKVFSDFINEYVKRKKDYSQNIFNNICSKEDPLDKVVKDKLFDSVRYIFINNELVLNYDIEELKNLYLRTINKFLKLDEDYFQEIFFREHKMDILMDDKFNNDLLKSFDDIITQQITSNFISPNAIGNFSTIYIIKIIKFYTYLSYSSKTLPKKILCSLHVDINGTTISLINFFFKHSLTILHHVEYYSKIHNKISFLERKDKYKFFSLFYDEIIKLFKNLLKRIVPFDYYTAFSGKYFIKWFDKNMSMLNSIIYNENLCYYLIKFFSVNTAFLEVYPNVCNQIDEMISKKVLIRNVKSPINIIKIDIIPFYLIFILKELVKKIYYKLTDEIEISIDILMENYINENKEFQTDTFQLCMEIYKFILNLGLCFSNKVVGNLKSNYSVELEFIGKLFESVELSYTLNDECIADYLLDENQVSIVSNSPTFLELQKNFLIEKYRENEKYCIKIFFEKPINCFFFSDLDYEILNNVDLNNKSDKEAALMEFTPSLKEIADNRSYSLSGSSFIFRTLVEKNYIYENEISIYSNIITFIFSLIINIYIAVQNDTYAIFSNYSNVFSSTFDYINLAHIAFLGLICINWLIFDVIYRVSSLKSSSINPHKFVVLCNLILSILAIVSLKLKFLYSITLLSVISLSETMQVVLKAIQMKYASFASTGTVVVIFTWIFSSISFYYLNSDYQNTDLPFNQCNNYFRCFSTIFTLRVRQDGSWTPDLFSATEPYYYRRFVYEWIYYIIINLVLLNAINGIIVDAFQGYREERNKHIENLENVCYICSLQRNDLDIYGISFDNHISEDHSVKYYVHFLIHLLENDKSNLSGTVSNVWDLFMKKKDMSFLPVSECYSLNLIKKKK